MKHVLFTLLLASALSACSPMSSHNSQERDDSANTMHVSASFYPLAYIAERIAGDNAIVTQIIPSGVEPHDYEPTSKQLSQVYNSTIILMNGQGMDPWAEKLRETFIEKGITVLAATDNADLLSALPEEEHHDEEGEEHHTDSEYDPHVWLDPVHMRSFTLRVRDAFIAADPTNADLYRSRTDALIADLSALDIEFRSNLSSCLKKKAIVSHNAFRYLARRYGFETIALAGISPGEEPSPKKMAEIITIAKREKLTFIFFETLVSPKLAETISRELGAKTLVLNPLEGLTADDIAAKETYLSIMKYNARNLALALECQSSPK